MSLLQQKKHSTTSNLTCASSFSSSAETLMSHDKPFDSIIIQALPLESRLEFVRRLWAPSTSSSSPGGSKKAAAAAAAAASARRSSLHGPHGELGYEPFFEYYLDQCTHALCDRGKHVSVRTHRDVLDIADLLKDGWTRDAVVRRLCSACQLSAAADDDEDSASESSSCIAPDSPVPTLKHHVDEESIHGSIDFVAKLLTMTSFGRAGGGTGQWQRGRLAWERGSLREALGQYFDKTPTLTMKAVQLEKVFNARNLQRFTNMQIEWTDNLADHLRMCEYEKKIRLFHHVTFLENHQGILPQTLIDETLKTIRLLFPSSDAKVQLWYDKHRLEHNLDPRAASHGALRSEDRIIDNFYYWKDRICILKQEFDEGTPKTFSQWWYDRRSGPQWYTFWIAMVVLVFTIFFGLVQSIEGALQVWKAFHPGG